MDGEPDATIEREQIEASMKSTLVAQGLDVQTLTMTPMSVTPHHEDEIIDWRVDVTYLGDPIVIDAAVVMNIGINLTGMLGPHLNSVWKEHSGLVTVSHEPAR